MTKNLLIVESPAKAKTIKKYLGKDFEVLASYGHVRDLVPKTGAIDIEHDFAMHYEAIEKNIKHVSAIVKALKGVDALYLATDPDREGEAISWHLCELLKDKKVLKKQSVYRVVFHEITKSAIKDAVMHPRQLSMDLVDAQQARRALDYLVGFNLSPLLWKKICYGLSAGRVQSPALRMIVEREAEIEQFKPQEYWTLLANASHPERQAQKFAARLTTYKDAKLTQFSITNSEQAHAIEQDLLAVAAGKLKVIKVEKKQRKRNPAPPFITSTLQQEAGRKLGFSGQRTMRAAQQLYEGINLGKEGHVGLITYMRTDSVTLAQEAIAEIRDVIKKKYGAENLPETPNYYKTKAKNAQEAHEAIRPTMAARTPEEMAPLLNEDQLKIYTLIWQRAVACQMIHATINTVAVDLLCGKGGVSATNLFRANGSTIADLGFIRVYREDVDDDVKRKNDNSDDNDKDKDEVKYDGVDVLLPEFNEGDIVDLLGINSEQHFTEPPPRYTEASLIKALEEYGIGRPSTYATIVSTLLNRKYVNLESKRFMPTEMGRLVNRFLTRYFETYVDYDFTAKLEDKLDEIARGENQSLPLLHDFWRPFKAAIDDATVKADRKDSRQELLDRMCPQCGKQLAIMLSKNGAFIGCTGYPDCTYTEVITKDGAGGASAGEALSPEAVAAASAAEAAVAARNCPDCGAPLAMKVGRYGKFIGCSAYPKCKYIESLNKPVDTGVECPMCKKGHLTKRKSRFGTYFYSCSKYPKCKYAVSAEPIAEACPTCGWPILMLKVTKRRGTEKVCPQKECGYVETIVPAKQK
jgi:DNA topoisomerase I